jgi:hypothetical protein
MTATRCFALAGLALRLLLRLVLPVLLLVYALDDLRVGAR